MYRVKHHRKRWRTRWPWKRVFPLRVDERYCRECGFPFHKGPLPKEIAHFDSGSISALVFPAGGFRRNEYVVRFGRWRAGGKQLYLSEFIPTQDLDDLLKSFAQLEHWLQKGRRTAVEQR